MRPLPAELRPATALPQLGKRPLRRLVCSALAIAAAAAVLSWQPALASVDDNWAYAMINETLSQRAREAGEHPRNSSRAGIGDADNDEARPQRNAPLKRKSKRHDPARREVASLGRDMAPAHLPPLSVIEWARPKTEVLLPAEPPKEVGPMIASLGRDFVAPPLPSAPSLTGDPIRWLAAASIHCLAAPLRGVLTELAAAFGPITVRWTCRSKALNARVGGAKRSYHLTGEAVDFNMSGNYRAILAFLKGHKLVGGLKHYGGGAFHIDTGPRRTW
jgi:hypothetical protein